MLKLSEIIENIETKVIQKSDEWLKLWKNKIGASQIGKLMAQNFNSSYFSTKGQSVNLLWGNIFEYYVYLFLKENENICSDINKDRLKINCGVFIYKNSLFSPDCMYIDDESSTVHIFEFKSPISRKADYKLFDFYKH